MSYLEIRSTDNTLNQGYGLIDREGGGIGLFPKFYNIVFLFVGPTTLWNIVLIGSIN